MKLFLQEFLNKKYVIGLIKLHSNLEIDNKININQNNKFSYLANRVNKNNNQVYEKNTITILGSKYAFNELI